MPLLDDSTAPEAEISAFGPVFVPALLLTPDGLLDGLVLMNPSDCGSFGGAAASPGLTILLATATEPSTARHKR